MLALNASPTMKTFFLYLLISAFPLALSGQTVKGRILDAATQEPIPLASVFFDGSFLGTASDEQGNFELNTTPYYSRPLTISAVGYFPYSLEDLDSVKHYTVLLGRDIYEIEEVSVSGKDIAKKRKAYLRLFKSEFIGATTNARRCFIMNEEDITFNYSTDQDTLRAIALKPLIIHNNALGYHFEYHLESFEFVKRTQGVFYKGSIVFTHDLAWEGYRKKLYQRRRRYAYTGSCKEFVRKLWSKDLKSSGYSMRNYHSGEVWKYGDVVSEDLMGRKYLNFQATMEIKYYQHISKIRLLEPEAFIDSDGFFDPASISWGGRMAGLRIADFLPYEFSLPR